MRQCEDNGADRKLGQYWEAQFCQMAAAHGFDFTPFQWGQSGPATFYTATLKSYTLPDIAIWKSPGQYHEIKHKSPTRHDSFSLEAYRYYALLHFAETSQQFTLYTIHNHALSGGREAQNNDIAHWITTDIRFLRNPFETFGYSWINGTKKWVKTLYWPTHQWIPLECFWTSFK